MTKIAPKAVFDKRQISYNFRRALAINADGADFLAARAIEELADRLSLVTRDFGKTLIIAPPVARINQAVSAMGLGEITFVSALDLAGEVLPVTKGHYDLVISLFHLHQVDDVPGVLIQMRAALKPDGLMIGCAPAQGTLSQLRVALTEAEVAVTGGLSPRISPFFDVRDMGGLLQRTGFSLPVVDGDEVTVRYSDMFALVRDLRAMGATNALLARARTFSKRGIFFKAAEIYGSSFGSDDGRIDASFHFVWFSGWAPDASQPKPLKPGSATHSLAQALGDKT